jgi:tryptophanyl-tRNA synthetase
MFPDRIFSGMRPTGSLHLGHYHGVLKNWVRLQSEYPCFFCVVDWHALTTHYETPEVIEKNVWEVLIDWLASGSIRRRRRCSSRARCRSMRNWRCCSA